MSAVISAFLQYAATMIYFVVIAAAGIFAGNALLKRKKQKDASTEDDK
jgi:hypothetical protein